MQLRFLKKDDVKVLQIFVEEDIWVNLSPGDPVPPDAEPNPNDGTIMMVLQKACTWVDVPTVVEE